MMCFSKLFEYLFGKKEEKKIEPKKNVYEIKRNVVSPCEKYFWNILKRNFDKYYIITPQVNLASIINRTDAHRYQNELYRNIDFGLFTKEDYKPILMIEINDKTHKQANRYQRDLKVRDILEKVNLPLVTFYTSYENKESYIVGRIEEKLKEI